MATRTVTTNADSGTGSLRQAIANAASGDTIVFDSTVFPAGTTTAIPLASTLTVSKTLTIDAGDPVKSGEGAQLQLKCRVALDGQNTVQIAITDTASTQITWHGVCFQNGYSSTHGGGLYFDSSSQNTLTECVFCGNIAGSRGGGLYTTATSQNTLTECVFSNNTANLGSGLFSSTSSQNTLTKCVFSNNTANISGDIYLYGYTSTKSTLNLYDGNVVSSLSVKDYHYNYVPSINLSGYNGVGGYIVDGTAPTIAGSGFLALPPGTSAKLANTIVRTDYGAGVSNFVVNGTSLSWSSTDATKSVLLEKQNGANWDVVSTSATSPQTGTEGDVYRIWDGVTFLTYAPPQTLVVTNTNDSGAGSLRQALADATAIDTITFDASLSGSTITLASGLTITNAVEIVGLVDNNGDPAITISGANTYRILSGNYQMTLSNLLFSNAGDHAIYNEDANGSTFTNCVFQNNSATDTQGGAVYLEGTTPGSDVATFTDCVFSSNTSVFSSVEGIAGALFAQGISINASNCTFSGNTAEGDKGGAIVFFSSYDTLTLNDCTFSGNCVEEKTAATGSYTGDCGGAIYSSGAIVATDCTFTSNTVNNQYDGDRGGAVYVGYDGTFTNCTFQYCTTATSNRGGAICVSPNSSLLLSGCEFRDAASDVALLTSSSLSTSSGITTIPTLSSVNATISIPNGAALTITNAATLNGSANSDGRGYLATPPGTDLSGVSTFNVVTCDYGAGVSAFSIDEDSADWTAANSNISVLLEKKVNNAWQTLAQPTGTSYSTTFVNGDEARIFDGIQFRTASAIVPQTLIVTNTNPTGAGSLAQAVLDARAVDTITFDSSLAGETITLNAGLEPRNEVTIVGLTDDDGNPDITVDGNGNYTFNSSYPVHVSNVAFDGGWGAFSSNGGFDGSTFENCTFENMDLNVFELTNSSQTAESVSFTDCIFTSNDAADVLAIGNVNATLSGGNVLTKGFDLTDATATVITNANYNGVGAYSAPSAGTASVAGSGNIALPDSAVVTVAQTVTRSEFGAGLTGISANELTISWTATDTTKSVLLEVENGADWDTVDDDATSPTTVSAVGMYRVWDGVAFFSTSVEPEPAIAVRPGRRVCRLLQFDYTNEGAETIAAGTAIKIGSAFGVIETAILPGATGAVTTLGTWFIPCLDTTVADFGDVAYWDDENQRVTSNDSGTMRIGLFVKPVSSGETEATVMIFPASAASSGD